MPEITQFLIIMIKIKMSYTKTKRRAIKIPEDILHKYVVHIGNVKIIARNNRNKRRLYKMK